MRHHLGQASILLLAAVSLASAQESADGGSTRGPRFLLASADRPVPIDVRRTPVLRQRLSLDLYNASVKAALTEIARQSGLELVYSDDVLPAGARVWLQAEGITVAAALTDVLADADVDVVFNRNGRAALVPRRAVGAPGRVAGRVTEAKTGQTIAGASVTLAGTRWHATTGEDGRYRLEDVAAGTYTLTVRRIGYMTGSTSVTVAVDQAVTADVRLELSSSPLDAVVVTGTIAPTEQKALANPISVITGDYLKDRGATKINDLFRGDIPGVFTADNGVFNAELGAPVYVRGTTSLSFYPTLKTYVDGVEIANSQHLDEIDPSMIDHVEIVRGPEAATLYGAQAINGVMQVFTKRGLLATPPHLTASFGVGALEGSYHNGIRHDDNVEVSGGTNDLSYNAGASYQHDGPWTRTSYLDEYSGYAGLTLRPRGSPLRVDVTTRLGERRAQSGSPEAEYRDMLNGTVRYRAAGALPSGNVLKLPEGTIGVTVHYAQRPTWQHTVTVGLDRGGNGYNGTLPPSYITPGDTFTTVFSTQTRRVTAAYNNSLDLHLAERVSANVTTGADYWYYDDHETFDNFTGYSYDKWYRDHSTGLFGQVRLGFADALFVTGGLRVDEGPALPADRHHRSTAPRIGVSYNLGTGSLRAKLRLGWGSALRPADPRFKPFKDFGGGYVQYASPDLKPERQNGWDGGFDLYAGDGASLTVTHYRQIARDLITVINPNDTSQQWVNLERVRNAGWELEGTLQLMHGLSARATYSEVESVVDALGPGDASGFSLGQDLPGVPHHTGALTLTERLPRLSLEAGVEYIGAQTNYDGNDFVRKLEARLGPSVFDFTYKVIPPAYRLALRVSYDVTPRITAFARVDNLNRDVVAESGFLGADQLLRTSTFGLRLR